MKTVIGVQSRMSSSRLPGKACLALADSTILGVTLKRAISSNYPTYLLTSYSREDIPLAKYALTSTSADVICGSPLDVRSRYLQLARMSGCDCIARVTADNPFTDFRFIDILCAKIATEGMRYCWVDPKCCPDGVNLEIFTVDFLLQSLKYTSDKYNQEHVTPWMRQHQNEAGITLNWYPKSSYLYHLGIDTFDDYVRMLTYLNIYGSNFTSLYENHFLDDFVKTLVESPYYPPGRRHQL